MKIFEILAAVSLMAISVPVESVYSMSEFSDNSEEMSDTKVTESSIQRNLQMVMPGIRSIMDRIVIQKTGISSKIKDKATKIKQKFKKDTVTEEQGDENSETFRELDKAMKNTLFPIYVQIRESKGGRAIYDFTVNKRGKTIKAKRRAKETKRILYKLVYETLNRQKLYNEIDLAKIARYIEELGKELGFRAASSTKNLKDQTENPNKRSVVKRIFDKMALKRAKKKKEASNEKIELD